MGFTLLVLGPGTPGNDWENNLADDWSQRLRTQAPDVVVNVSTSSEEAMTLVGEADAAFGNVAPELFQRATKLKWIACPQAGPPSGYNHEALVESDVVVTNARGIFGDYISAHIMAFVLAFARRLHEYVPLQLQRRWRPGPRSVYLPEATAVIVGVGGIGTETARLCAAFGMTVIGVDARRTEAPDGVEEMHPPEDLRRIVPRGDFVIVTVPETPETRGMFDSSVFRAMKPTAYFINIGRGATVVLDDLTAALEGKEIGGAALDVFQVEPLPVDHPLWTAPGVLITPHVAAQDEPHLQERRTELLVDNCVRFNEGRPLRNVVDKAHWY